MTRDYLTSVEILALHQELLRRYGGTPGVRDMGALEAAVFRPQCGYYQDIVEEAASKLLPLKLLKPGHHSRSSVLSCRIGHPGQTGSG